METSISSLHGMLMSMVEISTLSGGIRVGLGKKYFSFFPGFLKLNNLSTKDPLDLQLFGTEEEVFNFTVGSFQPKL